jgi:NAD(P)-dependent dehydrogenase (short-subunit alcohol dehydrogenase family)
MTGKVALVTGGSSGIGRATALAFAREGARVAIGSRRKSKAEEVVRAIRDRGGDAVWLQADVTDAAQVRTLVDRTVAAFGGLDYAFNNGGSGGKGRPTAEMDERDWDETIDGYLKSVWLCMKYEILEMLKRGGGVIVKQLVGRRTTRLSLSRRLSLLGSEAWSHWADKIRGPGIYLARNSHQCRMPRVDSNTTGRALDEA